MIAILGASGVGATESKELIAEAHGADALRLPAGEWNPARDLVTIIVGSGGMAAAHAQAEMLAAQGQARILVHDPERVLRVPGVSQTIAEWRKNVYSIPMPWPERLAVYEMDGSQPLSDVLSDTFGQIVFDLRMSVQTIEQHGPTWVRNTVRNLDELPKWPTIYHLRSAFADKPAIIVGAGPSLDKNAHLLPKLKGTALILACAQALPVLAREGVIPDAVVILDASDHRMFFDRAGIPASELTLILANQAHPSCFALGAKRCLTFSTDTDCGKWAYEPLTRWPVLTSGGSVSTVSLTLAVVWRMNPVILIGQDLAFTDNRFYAGRPDVCAELDGAGIRASGFSAEERASIEGDDLERAAPIAWLPAWDGVGQVRSDVQFASFHRWFVLAAAEWDRTRMMNATEGGARIDGMEHVPLETAARILDLEATESVDADKHLDEACAKDRTVWVEAAREQRRRAISQIERVLKLCRVNAVRDALAPVYEPIKWTAMLRAKELTVARDEDDYPRMRTLIAEAADEALGLLIETQPTEPTDAGK